MTAPPPYFERVRQGASRRWEQLEADPELAAPWHHLFNQVQSPRHVLSELLQNADDAGATHAWVRIENDFFVFEHDGEDFTEDHFKSLCRFGYSNKRALHTIGFRGIGFKSTFSIGDHVELHSPSLGVRFERERFTLPEWVGLDPTNGQRTRVRVAIADEHRRIELEKNLKDWLASPISFLFFKQLRRMTIGDQEIHWEMEGTGPVEISEWMRLSGGDDRFLLIRSEESPFPQECLDEIQKERMVGDQSDTTYPPCRVEIVVGAPGRFFVVLPTGVQTDLPFACNAPFIQDPARFKIKTPETSPTNRWLLSRIGKLAGAALLEWLRNAMLTEEQRAHAYRVLPDVDREDSTLDGSCAAAVELACAGIIDDSDYVLADGGGLHPSGECCQLPEIVLDVWPSADVVHQILGGEMSALSHFVSDEDTEKLMNWSAVESFDSNQFVKVLTNQQLPKPKTWDRLFRLWSHIAPSITGFLYKAHAKRVCIFPVQGKDQLCSPADLVRLGEKRLLQSEEDWQFLAQHLIVLNQNWLRFLAKVRRGIDDNSGAQEIQAIEGVEEILEAAGLDEPSDTNAVIDRTAGAFFSEKVVTLDDCIRLSQIAAKLGVAVSTSFQFVRGDLIRVPASNGIMVDLDGSLEEMIPASLQGVGLLHEKYLDSFDSCSETEWSAWIRSGKSKLLSSFPLVEICHTVYGRGKISEEIAKRGYRYLVEYPYRGSDFRIKDFDFHEDYWRHWKGKAKSDPEIWTSVVERMVKQLSPYLENAKSARPFQVSQQGTWKEMTSTGVLSSWLVKLRKLPCLRDTNGIPRRPDELLRRTPETEALIDVEPFVVRALDTSDLRNFLDLLGVRNKPDGPERLLQCLRTFSQSTNAPPNEVDKWYRRLDLMFGETTTEIQDAIRKAFESENLILGRDGNWYGPLGIFISADDADAPCTALIRESVVDLAIWLRIGVAERPSLELALKWLNTLPSGTTLPGQDLRRVKSLLGRMPINVWKDCERWLNLDGELVPVSDLAYAVTMQSLVPWKHLHPEHRKKTADLQFLPEEITGKHPFDGLDLLASRIQERVQSRSVNGNVRNIEWLQALAGGLRRADFDGEEDTARLRQIADRLFQTSWIDSDCIEIMPYIDGTPAGTARKADVAWLDRQLLVTRLPNGKLARLVPEEIGKAFNRREIRSALDYAFGRAVADVVSYLEENFKLMEMVEEPTETQDNPQSPGGEIPEDAPTGDTDAPEGGPSEEPSELVTDEPPGEEPPADDSQDGEDGEDGKPKRPSKHFAPKGPSLIERFAASRGFKPMGDRFVHPNGEWLGKVRESLFGWEKRNTAGDLLCSYWIKEHCLERDPLELNAAVWNLLNANTDRFALVLTDPAGNPVEWPGYHLSKLLASREITLHPATYRLVHDSFREA